jgi:hypothetical protein
MKIYEGRPSYHSVGILESQSLGASALSAGQPRLRGEEGKWGFANENMVPGRSSGTHCFT